MVCRLSWSESAKKSPGILLYPIPQGRPFPCSSFAAGRPFVAFAAFPSARGSKPSLASVQVHYFSAMKSSLFETANGATQQVFLIDA